MATLTTEQSGLRDACLKYAYGELNKIFLWFLASNKVAFLNLSVEMSSGVAEIHCI